MNPPVCSIFFHNYYGEHDRWIDYFSKTLTVSFNLYYNIVSNSTYNVSSGELTAQQLQQTTPQGNLKKLVVRQSPNQGKDIGGKLVLFDTYLHLKQHTEYLLFFHDKKSPHEVQGFEWSQKLSRILSAEFTNKAIDVFTTNKNTGVIATHNSIQNEKGSEESVSHGLNSKHIKEQQALHGIDTATYDYVAGTMFWARSEPYVKFFSKQHPFEIRKILEYGNVMDIKQGSYTHAWERLLCWIVSSQGYTIKGIE